LFEQAVEGSRQLNQARRSAPLSQHFAAEGYRVLPAMRRQRQAAGFGPPVADVLFSDERRCVEE